MNKLFLLVSVMLFSCGNSVLHRNYSGELNILFYNTENFFDLHDDPQTRDEDFLPDGAYTWTAWRFEKKRNQLAKVILSSCGFVRPDLVGLAEVENRIVVERLCREGPLASFGYRVIHRDSPDERGIDVALIYRPETVKPLHTAYIPLSGKDGKPLSSREILYVVFSTVSRDTLHVFFNHWPSRGGGQVRTEPLRMLAARTLRSQISEILAREKYPKIIVMGDFNDQPHNRSMRKVLGAVEQDDPQQRGELVNLSAAWLPRGSLKYRQSWQLFDQALVSDFLLEKDGLQADLSGSGVLAFDFLLEPDPKYKGKRPYRTYIGPRYHGGISDHLPVRLRLVSPDYLPDPVPSPRL